MFLVFINHFPTRLKEASAKMCACNMFLVSNNLQRRVRVSGDGTRVLYSAADCTYFLFWCLRRTKSRKNRAININLFSSMDSTRPSHSYYSLKYIKLCNCVSAVPSASLPVRFSTALRTELLANDLIWLIVYIKSLRDDRLISKCKPLQKKRQILCQSPTCTVQIV